MKAKEILKTLDISRTTLSRLVAEGKILTKIKSNGRHEYDKKSVLKLKEENLSSLNREIILYARIPKGISKSFLDKQVKLVKSYCEINHIMYDDIITEHYNLNSWEDRIKSVELIEKIIYGKVKSLIMYSSDVFAVSCYSLLETLCKRYETELVVISNKELGYESDLGSLVVESPDINFTKI